SSEVLLDGRSAATQSHVQPVGRGERLLQRRLDTGRHEMKRRAALHLKRRAWMVGEHEYRVMKRRIVAPPAFPVFVLPFAADRSEHVAAHDRRADASITSRNELIVEALLAGTLRTVDLTEGAGGKRPFVQSAAAHAERIVQALVRSRRVAVERDREVVHAQFWHPRPSLRSGRSNA